MAGSYYLNPDVDLSKLGRVALVEFDNRSSYPEMPAALSDGLFVALQKKQQFGLFEVGKSEPSWWDDGGPKMPAVKKRKMRISVFDPSSAAQG